MEELLFLPICRHHRQRNSRTCSIQQRISINREYRGCVSRWIDRSVDQSVTGWMGTVINFRNHQPAVEAVGAVYQLYYYYTLAKNYPHLTREELHKMLSGPFIACRYVVFQSVTAIKQEFLSLSLSFSLPRSIDLCLLWGRKHSFLNGIACTTLIYHTWSFYSQVCLTRHTTNSAWKIYHHVICSFCLLISHVIKCITPLYIE